MKTKRLYALVNLKVTNLWDVLRYLFYVIITVLSLSSICANKQIQLFVFNCRNKCFGLFTSVLIVSTGIFLLHKLIASSTVFENSVNVTIAFASESLSCFEISSKNTAAYHHKNFYFSLSALPAVYSGFKVVSVNPPDNAPNITIGYSGTFGRSDAITSPLASFSFFLRALLRFFDFVQISSYVYFLPVMLHS